MAKERLDVLLVERNLAPSRERAKSTIMGVLAALAKIKQNLDSLSRFDTSLDEVRKMVEDASCQLQEASYEVRDYGESLAFEPQRLDQMQSRMDVIYRLRKKYGATLADVQLHHQKVKEELAAIENYDEDIVELKKTIAADYQEARDAAAVLTEQRQRAARDISREIEEQLLALGMPNARFRLELSALPELTANGAEQLAMGLMVSYSMSFFFSLTPRILPRLQPSRNTVMPLQRDFQAAM